MSGHSKWSTIKRQKGANDAKRGQQFTKIANAITVAVKAGNSGDPDANPRLRMVLDQARAINLPKENVQRAIDRGLGKLPGQILEEVIYEGFGPGKVALIIESVTDNKMRTTSEIRNLLERSGGTLGSSGVVSYMFDRVGQLKVTSKSLSSDEEELTLIDCGAEDIEIAQEGDFSGYFVYTQPANLNIVSNKITQEGFTVLESKPVFKPNLFVEINDQETAQKIINLIERVEEHDDVQEVSTNLKISDKLIDQF